MSALQIFSKIIFLVLLSYLQTTHAASDDQNALSVAKKNACLGCHAINKKIVGPSFESIALKYKKQKNILTIRCNTLI